MKLLRADEKSLVFRLSRIEQQLLLDLVRRFPMVPATHARLSRRDNIPNHQENQRLLEVSLAQHRHAARRQVLAMLDTERRFRETETGLELTLTPAEVEWLLQVLNDVRVGCWLALGEPDESEEPEITDENQPFALAMDGAGFFQMALLAATNVGRHQRPGLG